MTDATYFLSRRFAHADEILQSDDWEALQALFLADYTNLLAKYSHLLATDHRVNAVQASIILAELVDLATTEPDPPCDYTFNFCNTHNKVH
jgi:hypothetical protein